MQASRCSGYFNNHVNSHNKWFVSELSIVSYENTASSCHILLRYKIIVSFLFKNLLKIRNHAVKYTFLRIIFNTRSRKWFVSELFIIFWWKHNALSCHLPLRYNILMWPQDRRPLSSLHVNYSYLLGLPYIETIGQLIWQSSEELETQ